MAIRLTCAQRSAAAFTGSPTAPPAPCHVDAPSEWRRPATGMTLGLLLFETATGLSIYILGFSVFNQISVLVHTALGLLMVPPLVWYLGQHWRRRYRGNFSHYQLLGYVSAAALLVLLVSGLVLTWQAAFDVRIGAAWDLVHVIATFVLIAALGAHLLTLLFRRGGAQESRRLLRRAQASCFWQALAWGAVPAAACGLLVVAYRPLAFDERFPSDYSFKYGADRPFAPSLARKDMAATEQRLRERILAVLDAQQQRHFAENFRVDPVRHEGLASVADRLCAQMSLDAAQRNAVRSALAEARAAFAAQGAIDPRQLAGSFSCGRSGCHTQILEEWQPSAHRYSSMDFVFQKVQEDFARERAPETVRYCAGCHDPIALFAGAKNVGNETLSVEGANEGVSCLVCHSTIQTDVRGNADYTIAPQPRYLYELDERPVAQWINSFLIRAYPREHVRTYSRPLYKTAEACGACHKQFIDEEVNDFGWVQGQNQYDSWRKSRWHKEGDVAGSISCRECHMPLIDSTDPAAGDKDDPNRHPKDGKHRSHRFLAANQFVPRYHNLPGAEEHCALTVQWLRGEYEIPELGDRWTRGPVVRLDLIVPQTVRPGEEVHIQTVVTNNKAGHDVPTGPLDMIEGWVEVTVTDQDGRIVFASSRADGRGYLVNPNIVFKAELIDKLGQLIGRHELWQMVGARFKRALFPGVADATTFSFTCPGIDPVTDLAASPARQTRVFAVPAALKDDTLKVTAIMWYTKYSAPFLDRLFGEQAGIRAELTDIARAEAVLRIARQQERETE